MPPTEKQALANLSSPDNLRQALEQLKSSARSLQEIAAFIKANIGLFGFPVEDNAGFLSVGATWDLERILMADPELDDDVEVVDINVSIQLKQESSINALVMETFGCEEDAKDMRSMRLSFQLSLQDWPVLIAQILLFHLDRRNNYMDYEQLQMPQAVVLLDRYLPAHFPHMTRHQLESLQDNGLLPVDADGEFDQHTALPLLFGQQAHAVVHVPEGLSPD